LLTADSFFRYFMTAKRNSCWTTILLNLYCFLLFEGVNHTSVLADVNHTSVLADVNHTSILADVNHTSVLADVNHTSVLADVNSTAVIDDCMSGLAFSPERAYYFANEAVSDQTFHQYALRQFGLLTSLSILANCSD